MLLNENVMILFSSEDCWLLKMNIFQESNQLVAPGGFPTLLTIQTEERDSRRKLDETDGRKITMDLVYFYPHTDQFM